MEIKYLQILVMDNGEILCCGKSIGQIIKSKKGHLTMSDFIFTKDEIKKNEK